MSSSSSSSSSSSRSSTPEPTPKRKREAEDSDSDGDSSDSGDSDAAEDGPEVPVLSHAEQRRQKRREKQEKLGQAAKKRKLPDGSAVAATGAPAKRQNSVWVGNMAFKTTTEALTEFFKEAGEITRIHMPTKPSTAPGIKAENRGYAYVDFTTAEGKKAAIALSEQNLFGRKLLIKDGDDFTGRPAVPGADPAAAGSTDAPKTHSKTAQKILRAQKQPPAPTLFLGNLGFETTDISIRELFDAHRPVKKAKIRTEDNAEGAGAAVAKPEADDKWIRKVRMGTFEDSGLCKGFAFVDFTSIEHATSVLVNPKNYTLNGRKLVVEYASADAVRRGAPKGKREDGPGGAERMPQRRKEAKSRGPRAEKNLERERKAGDKHGHGDDAASADGGRPAYDGAASASHNADGGREREWKGKGPRNRPKPGAALALAKRESAAIVPSQGKKLVF
ncbi:hypothetical protein C8F04DRAFT_596479 [Mycena alexandri]|uniref:RRM domain-containing protein n=1 Tax=Mycena alexandri TaxID=1745969 RepID=A0AAD6XEA7_9AGAR|nr:hypothetical protein C8F04DRAFT_596479 [Mycena alexandri]